MFRVRDSAVVVALALVSGHAGVETLYAQVGSRALSVSSRSGLRVIVSDREADPELHVLLPGRPVSDTTIRVLFPEHITALRHGDSVARQLYVFNPGPRAERPRWRVTDQSLEYEREIGGGVRVRGRATVDDDGVRFLYEFANRSTQGYDMITAVTDPRITGEFLDQRLERTFVHHADGFDLLASQTPDRLTAPLSAWLPVRYLASFRWPVPPRLRERRVDGITYLYKSRPVDEPFIATRSIDGSWIIASFARDAGNVWSNPELTCQHVHQEVRLGIGDTAAMEFKLLLVQGSLDDALRRARQQRPSLH